MPTHASFGARDFVFTWLYDLDNFLEPAVPCHTHISLRKINLCSYRCTGALNRLYYRTRMFIAVLTRARRWTLLHSVYLRLISVLSSHLCLAVQSGLFRWRFPTKMCANLPFAYCTHCLLCPSPFDDPASIWWGVQIEKLVFYAVFSGLRSRCDRRVVAMPVRPCSPAHSCFVRHPVMRDSLIRPP